MLLNIKKVSPSHSQVLLNNSSVGFHSSNIIHKTHLQCPEPDGPSQNYGNSALQHQIHADEIIVRVTNSI